MSIPGNDGINDSDAFRTPEEQLQEMEGMAREPAGNLGTSSWLARAQENGAFKLSPLHDNDYAYNVSHNGAVCEEMQKKFLEYGYKPVLSLSKEHEAVANPTGPAPNNNDFDLS